MNDITRLSQAFTTVVRSNFTIKELREINKRNKAYEITHPGCCATHDFCDANMLMAEAFHNAFKREPDVGSEEDAQLWSAAWNDARTRKFSF